MNIALDTNHDLIIEENNLKMIADTPDEVVQKLKQRLKFFFGEWFLDNTLGLPYFQEILGKSRNPSRIEALLKNEILKTVGVTELQSFSLDLDTSTRELTLEFQAQSQNGPIIFSEVIP